MTIYKGYGIDFNIYGSQEYSIQYGSDDLIFETEEEAKAFIDSVAGDDEAVSGKLQEIVMVLKAGGYDASITSVDKTNKTLEAIQFTRNGTSMLFYEDMFQAMSVEESVVKILDTPDFAPLDQLKQILQNGDAEAIMSLLKLHVCRKQWNQKRLENTIYKQIGETDLVYVVVLEAYIGGSVCSSIITKDQNWILENHISEQELYEEAKKNTIGTEEILELSAPEFSMLIGTNHSKVNGAAAALLPECLEGVQRDMMAESLLVIPSSVHEVIYLNGEHYDLFGDLSGFIRAVNTGCVNDTEVLSDHPYLWKNGVLTSL